MNSDTLETILSYCIRNARFLGVFPRDQIPLQFEHYPCCFIANTDTSRKSGEHWNAFYLESPAHVEFFDSYGLPPSAYRYPLPCTSFNNMRLQGDTSNVCGQYCIQYLLQRTRGLSLHSFQRSFSALSYAWNDLQVARNAYNNFSVSSRYAKCQFCSQTSLARIDCTCIPSI